jgi:hypothetical protein
MLRGALALLLGDLFGACGAILGHRFLLLMHAFLAHLRVALDVPGGLLAAAEQLVQPTHSFLLLDAFRASISRNPRLLACLRVAKKTRTPPPPRRVQAPQRRQTATTRTTDERRRYVLLLAFGASGVIGLIVALILVFVVGKDESSAAGRVGPAIPISGLPGLQTGPAPWPVEYNHMPDRLGPLDLDQLPAEALNFHIHAHLDIFINGKKTLVPANAGIYDGEWITELHTHDTRGVIHVEAPAVKDYTLGQFIGIWGVRFTPKCIGGYCATASKPFRTYLNGKPYDGDPTRLVLHAHDEIALVYGKPPKTIPKSYQFYSGE